MGPPGKTGPKGDPGSIENLSVAGVGQDSRGNIPLTAIDINAVPLERKINKKSLSTDIELSADDVGAKPADWTPITSGTEDITPGESPLETGHVYLVYE